MATDFVPKSPANLAPWLGKLIAKFPGYAATGGWAADRITEFVALLSQLKTLADGVVDAQSALSKALGDLASGVKQMMPDIRKGLANFKTSTGVTEGMIDELEIVTAGGANADLTAVKLKITSVKALPGHVVVSAVKHGLAAANVYGRIKGQANYTLIAQRIGTFPFNDTRPLAQEGVPEEREYMIMGVVGDAEVGVPSDSVSVLYGG